MGQITSRVAARSDQALKTAVLAAVFTLFAVLPSYAEVSTLDGAQAGLNIPAAAVSDSMDHYQIVRSYYENSSTFSLADKLRTARSAWALGLIDDARRIWAEIMANENFRGIERARTILASTMMELQESNPEASRAMAEKTVRELPESELRAQFWLVIAESLREQGAYSLAEGYYEKAVFEGRGNFREEALFLLGECRLKLGLTDKARYSFAEVETSSDYAKHALRRLIEIDLMQKNYEGVLTWAEEGRERFSFEFHEPWPTYALITALVELSDTARARKELDSFRTRYSELNPWYTLSQSAVEAGSVKQEREGLDRGKVVELEKVIDAAD